MIRVHDRMFANEEQKREYEKRKKEEQERKLKELNDMIE
jgi:hypothetical protein